MFPIEHQLQQSLLLTTKAANLSRHHPQPLLDSLARTSKVSDAQCFPSISNGRCTDAVPGVMITIWCCDVVKTESVDSAPVYHIVWHVSSIHIYTYLVYASFYGCLTIFVCWSLVFAVDCHTFMHGSCQKMVARRHAPLFGSVSPRSCTCIFG